jgi:phage tail-like protein
MTGPLAVPNPGSSPAPRVPPHKTLAAVLPSGSVRPRRSAQWMLDQLPVGMLESEFFARFVSIFQEVGTTLLEDADNLEHVSNISVTPTPFVRWLGSWIGAAALDPSLDEHLQRRIVGASARMLTWRGTARGLHTFLELVCGEAVEMVDGGGIWREGEAPADTAFLRVRVRSTGWMSERDFIALIRDEVPAHVRAELWIGDRLAWQSTPEPKPSGSLPDATAALPPPAPPSWDLFPPAGPAAAPSSGVGIDLPSHPMPPFPPQEDMP